MAERQEKDKLKLPNRKFRIGIVQAQFNQDVTDAQLAEAMRCLDEYGVEVDVIKVPGSFELPYILQQQAASGKFHGLIAIGCLVKGDTIHFEVVSYSLPVALHRLIQEYKLPIGFGVVTANTLEQAAERSWLAYDAAYAVLQSLIETESLRT